MFPNNVPDRGRGARSYDDAIEKILAFHQRAQRSRINRFFRWFGRPARPRRTFIGRLLKQLHIPYATRSEVIFIPIGILVMVVLYIKYPHSGASPTNGAVPASPIQSITAATSAVQPTVSNSSAMQQPTGSASPNQLPPSKLPTTTVADIPPPAVLRQLQQFVSAYYTQESTDTQTSYDARLKAAVSPDVWKTLLHSIVSPTGTTVSSVADMANATSKSLTGDRLYVTMPVEYIIAKPNMVPRAYNQLTYSVWQSHTDGSWTLTLFKSDNTAQGS